MTERVQKLLAAAGLCSRRTAEEWIAAGRVTVNGRAAHIGDKADPETDTVAVDGRPVGRAAGHVYIMLHKPRGYVTTLSDERGRRTAAELVKDCGVRVYPVGRLDRDSEGLLLFTNDGALTQRLLHPSHQVDKVYTVSVSGADEGSAGRLRAVTSLDGQPIAPAQVDELYRRGDRAEYRVVIHQGKKRQIRRMCAAVGLTVTRLCRIAEGGLELGALPPGRWRHLTAGELESITDMNENVLQTIRSGMDGFSKGQKRIAAFILDNYDRAAFMTAARLGETASVSESTVVRFAAQLGYDGYPEMQKALQELIRGKLTSIQRIQVSRDQMSGADILGSVMQRDMNSIHNVIDRLDRDAFSCAVDKLLGAKHIYILGVRSSSFLAGYLNFYMHLIFKNVTLVQSSAAGEIYEQLAHIGKGDVLVGICFPRYSKMAIHAVEYASRKGGDVVAITDSALSPLYQMASVSLLAPCDMISFVDSMAAPLSLLNALILEQVWSRYSIFGKDDE